MNIIYKLKKGKRLKSSKKATDNFEKSVKFSKTELIAATELLFDTLKENVEEVDDMPIEEWAMENFSEELCKHLGITESEADE